MKLWVVSDTHWNEKDGSPMRTHCLRPPDYTRISLKRWNETVRPEDTVIHLGDVINGTKREVKAILDSLHGKKIHVRGNHDRDKACSWWMDNGFAFSCDWFVLRNVLFTHEPANAITKSNGNRPYDMLEEGLPYGCELNVHGHLHNVWNGFMDEERYERDKALLGIDFKKQLRYPWQRLFAIEYTDYRPVELGKFLAHPQKYQSTEPKKAE
ncbi:Calcineurin-like phosphoesterase [uncultured archaeon]|nr:Calcineurin-like phosphoesterase [uncultured archaeon]